MTKIYQESLISYDRLNEIINIPIERNGEIYINQINEIELRNLNFSYTGDGFIISNFNYIFRKGNIYGIKGTNGIGKSTLIKLMLGLYQDYEGEIFYNSLDIKKIKYV
ncbi:ATP-binding cassette domain-containing protein [Thermobrachium celere]|uniref:ATP-binding cassette domain-containing protein n=1 Tax=Thermobrachium celere TaxID=53422 RepID=UPI001A3A0114|nr:ATP-binding cassette domain-containing protein [Thermobrachium celere]GFR34196.1 hypothetical protein TCEA9_00080 [Thermobrachium celere]